ncbi:MAG: Major facilitator superfamily protein [Candidatus Tokpelaia sp. JSC161]|jgi:FSR family fosmidomycin resistance protein-like MFS transporter|nr:MAG: Major facilitator superfamily protein [Candidatus Tokpelaia sp. JSC161]
MIQKQSKKKAHSFFAVIISISLCHLLNDLMQSMLPAIYPLLRAHYNLSLLKIGIITATFQITGSILQPLVGIFTDKHPIPYSLPCASIFTMSGLFLISKSHNYHILVMGAACLGFGSSIFHPEASRITRIASCQQYSLSQSIFQLGGNLGSSLGPLFAALFITQQKDIIWVTMIAFIGFILLIKVSLWETHHKTTKLTTTHPSIQLSQSKIRQTLLVLIALMIAKQSYVACMSNFYTLFSIEQFNLSIHQAQYLLFLYLAGVSIGTLLGATISDYIGIRPVIWISILGILPFTIALPYVNLPTMAILSFIIGMILASAFPAIIVFAQELIPGKPGTIAGLFFGLSFGIGSLSSAILGAIGDIIGMQQLFINCSFLPFLGFVAIFLPKITNNSYS